MNRIILGCMGFIVATTATVAGYKFQQSKQASPSPSAPSVAGNSAAVIGSPRPEFSLKDVSGQIRHISEWDGKVIAINFWATWCPPCIKEIPEFVELQEQYGEQGLQFLGIALQRAEEVTGFMAEHGMNYPVLAGELEVIQLAEEYGNDIGALPYTVIVDRSGKIHYVKKGPLHGADAEAVISKLL